MHGDAAGRVLGDRVRLDERVESLDDLDADAIVVAVPPAESARLLGEPDPGLERLADRLRPPPLRPADPRRPARRAPRLGRALGLRPRRADGPPARARPVPHRRLERRPGAAGDPRPRARRPHRRPAHGTSRRRGARLVARQPRAVRDDRAAARRRASRRRDRPSRRRARGNVDRHRLAGDDGERRAQRPRGGSAPLEHRCCESLGMSATEELTAIDAAIERGTRRLLELQRPDGVWVGELESNVTMTAQHLFWNHYLGLRTPELDRRIANELMARMRDDGTWSIWFEGPAGPLDVDRGVRRAAHVRRRSRARRRSRTSSARAASRRAVSSRSASSRCSASGRGSGWCRSRRSSSCCRRRRRSRSTTSPAGRGRRSSRSSLAQSLRPVQPIDVDLRMLGARPARTRPPLRRDPLRRTRAGARRAVDPRAAGGGRLVGRDPAAVGVGDHRPARARPRPRGRDAAARRSRAGRASWSRTATGSAPRRASRRSGTPRSPLLALRACGAPARPSAARARPASTSSGRR